MHLRGSPLKPVEQIMCRGMNLYKICFCDMGDTAAYTTTDMKFLYALRGLHAG